jgi:hypothetical protein
VTVAAAHRVGLVPHELVDHALIDAGRGEVRGERVAKGVESPQTCPLDCALQRGVPRSTARSWQLSNAGSSKLRWALSIRPSSSWRESKLQRLPNGGFRLQAWNRKPRQKLTFKIAAKDLGLKSDGEVLSVQLNGAAFRLPAEVEVSWTPDKIAIKVIKAAKIRLDYGVLRPGWVDKEKLVLKRCSAQAADIVREDVTWNDAAVEWQAVPGDYELQKSGQ